MSKRFEFNFEFFQERNCYYLTIEHRGGKRYAVNDNLTCVKDGVTKKEALNIAREQIAIKEAKMFAYYESLKVGA